MVRIADIVPTALHPISSWRSAAGSCASTASVVRDGIDYRFLEVDGDARAGGRAAGLRRIDDLRDREGRGRAAGHRAGADPVRQCANKCVFCFIDGNPAGARQSLHLKDDDFRLSFTYGSYVTLTNLGPNGFQRLIEQRLSPLYVSVHATEPAVRMRLLGVERGGEIVEQLRELTAAGIEVHTQVVLCPGWNDGAHLDRTIDDLWELGPGVLSLSVVPVGLTQYNVDRPVRLLTAAEAGDALARSTPRARRGARSGAPAGRTPATSCTSSRAGRCRPRVLRRLAADGERRRRRALAARRFDAGLAAVPRCRPRIAS
jgi:hypothetical protein